MKSTKFFNATFYYKNKIYLTFESLQNVKEAGFNKYCDDFQKVVDYYPLIAGSYIAFNGDFHVFLSHGTRVVSILLMLVFILSYMLNQFHPSNINSI